MGQIKSTGIELHTGAIYKEKIASIRSFWDDVVKSTRLQLLLSCIKRQAVPSCHGKFWKLNDKNFSLIYIYFYIKI